MGNRQIDRDEKRVVAQLLDEAPPLKTMPEHDKRRVLEALENRVRGQADQTTRLDRPTRWRAAALAAAAVLAFGVLAVFWPGGGSGGIAWADVLRQLESVHTMSGPLKGSITAPDGTIRTVTGRIFFKDPGLHRVEKDELVVTRPDGSEQRSAPPDSVVIVRQLPEDTVSLELFPERQEAIRTELDLTGSMLGPWREMSLNPAATAWFRLSELPESATRSIGRREIEGEPAVGFAAPLAALMGPQPLVGEPNGEVRVWASAATAVPLAVEIRTEVGEWFKVETVEPITWGADLQDSLFDDSSIEGFTIHERKMHTRGFPAPKLKPEVTLRIGPEIGGPVVNELDVVGAVAGTILFESWKRVRYHTIITFELTEEAADRLQRFLTEQPDTRLQVDFNGEFVRPWFHPQVTSRFIQVELFPLRKRLIDFEIGYLAGGREAALAEVERQRALRSTPTPAD